MEVETRVSCRSFLGQSIGDSAGRTRAKRKPQATGNGVMRCWVRLLGYPCGFPERFRRDYITYHKIIQSSRLSRYHEKKSVMWIVQISWLEHCQIKFNHRVEVFWGRQHWPYLDAFGDPWGQEVCNSKCRWARYGFPLRIWQLGNIF